jgi:hypothetical protein
MTREPPSDDKAHVLLGALVRSVLGRRRATERLARVPFPVRMAVRGRRRALASRWAAFGAGALAVAVAAFFLTRGQPGLQYTTSGDRMHFSDGSDVIVGRDSHLAVMGVTERGAQLRLDGGGAQLRLLGKPGALWTVDAGPYTLVAARVTLDLSWSQGQSSVSVSVRSGRAVIRGPFGNRKEVRLSPGQVLAARATDRSWRLDSGRAEGVGRCRPSDASSLAASEAWVRLDDRGCLGYGYDDNGNRVPDFSHAGYRGGGVPLPFVPRSAERPALLPGSGGDDTPAIQAALDAVAARPADPEGFRGVVELGPGSFTVAGTLRILASGVVLRGQGPSGAGATVLRAVGPGRPVLVIGPGTGRSVAESHRVTDQYVPVGARSFEVDEVGDLQVGDDILVRRPSTQRWLTTVAMTSKAAGIIFERRITDIEGRRITIDVPLTNALEKEFTEATVSKYRFAARIAEVGVERLAGRADFDPRSDLGDGIFIDVDAAMNAWVRQVRAENYEGAAVSLEQFSKWVTVEDVVAAAPAPPSASAWSRAFLMGGQQNLMLRNQAIGARRALDSWARAAGPNVVHDLTVIGPSSLVKPSRWTNGLLLDGVRLTDQAGAASGAIVIENQQGGRDPGWSAANSVLWNCRAGQFVVDSPPTAQNWVMGAEGVELGSTGSYDRTRPAKPESLYRAQLAERLGEHALAALVPADR